MKPLPPTRLLDDPAVARLVRADLARATKVPAIAFDGARGLAALEAAIQSGAAHAAPFASSTTTGATAAGKSLAAAVAKGLLLGLVTVGVVATMGGQESPPKPHQASSTTSTTSFPELHPAVEIAAPPALLEPQALEAPAPPPRALAPAPGSGASISGSRGPHTAESSVAPVTMGGSMPPALPAPSGASQLQMEVDNLARLRALEPADPQQALALAEEGRRLFPGGLYAQEREALAISALVRLGRRGEAEARARAFVAAYPRSHLVERIRALTGVGAKD